MQVVIVSGTRVRVSQIVSYQPYSHLEGTSTVWFIDIFTISGGSAPITTRQATLQLQTAALASLDAAMAAFNETLPPVTVNIPDPVQVIAGLNLFSTPADFPIKVSIPDTIHVADTMVIAKAKPFPPA